MGNPKQKQGGYALLLLTASLAIIAFGFVLGYSNLLAKKESGALAAEQTTYLNNARTALENVYQQNLAVVDSDSEQAQYRNPDTWLQSAGIQPRWNVQVQVSSRLTASGVAYTVIALWIPDATATSDPSTFDPASGTFTPCSNSGAACPPRAYVVVSGLTLQLKAQQLAQAQLNDLSGKTQSFFDTKALQDPDHNQSVNYFRAPSGNCNNMDEMPCLDTYTDVSATRLPQLMGVDPQQLVNPWGLPVQASNLQDARSTTPPYSFAFQSQTPWGTTYQVQALQKL